MIEANLEFAAGSLKQVLKKLLSLPADLRPTHHSFGEDERGKLIADPERFMHSAAEQSPGPYLTGLRCSYDLSVPRAKPIRCSGELDVDHSLAKQLLVHMATARPIFGFACAADERHQRNRVTVTQGVNTIESWVGRDTQKYVPGLYWLTLIPAALADQHGVPLSAIKKVAQEHVELDSDQHLFRFYERPENWRDISAVAELCASLPGLFDVQKVKPHLQAAKNFLELEAILKTYA